MVIEELDEKKKETLKVLGLKLTIESIASCYIRWLF